MKADHHPAASLFQHGIKQGRLRLEFAEFDMVAPDELFDLYQHFGGQEFDTASNQTAFWGGYWFLPPQRIREEYVINVDCGGDDTMLPFLGRDADFYCLDISLEPSEVSAVYLCLKEYDPTPVFDSFLAMAETLNAVYECERQKADPAQVLAAYTRLNPRCAARHPYQETQRFPRFTALSERFTDHGDR